MRRKLLCLGLISITFFTTCEDKQPHNNIEYQEGEPCKNNKGCQTGLVCRANVCRKVCQVNADCQMTEQHCIEGVCLQGKSTKCGNGIREADEECDDGNLENGNGCSSICRIEQGYRCKEDSQGRSICKQCGNGIIEADEACDDGDKDDNDGCSANCVIETDFTCTGKLGERSICKLKCGNGVIEEKEQCDDGNNVDGDGCNSLCRIEEGFHCKRNNGKISICETICSDGFKTNKEECDDGNADNGDGCDNQCTIEPNFNCMPNEEGISVCNCDLNHYGPNCELCPVCRNGGFCKSDIFNVKGCVCHKDTGWSGKDCSICAVPWEGEECNEIRQVVIGNQTWLTYNISELIGYDGTTLTCYANTDKDPEFIENYGCLYLWSDALKVCPQGWHLPTKEEVEQLLDSTTDNRNTSLPNPSFLALAAKDPTWSSNISDQITNSTLWSALPAGEAIKAGAFYSMFGTTAYFWTSTTHEKYENDAWYLKLHRLGGVGISYFGKDSAFSVRCIKDAD